MGKIFTKNEYHERTHRLMDLNSSFIDNYKSDFQIDDK